MAEVHLALRPGELKMTGSCRSFEIIDIDQILRIEYIHLYLIECKITRMKHKLWEWLKIEYLYTNPLLSPSYKRLSLSG
jgi:hypothetical protein